MGVFFLLPTGVVFAGCTLTHSGAFSRIERALAGGNSALVHSTLNASVHLSPSSTDALRVRCTCAHSGCTSCTSGRPEGRMQQNAHEMHTADFLCAGPPDTCTECCTHRSHLGECTSANCIECNKCNVVHDSALKCIHAHTQTTSASECV